jgi:hypothetical protein
MGSSVGIDSIEQRRYSFDFIDLLFNVTSCDVTTFLGRTLACLVSDGTHDVSLPPIIRYCVTHGFVISRETLSNKAYWAFHSRQRNRL